MYRVPLLSALARITDICFPTSYKTQCCHNPYFGFRTLCKHADDNHAAAHHLDVQSKYIMQSMQYSVYFWTRTQLAEHKQIYRRQEFTNQRIFTFTAVVDFFFFFLPVRKVEQEA